MPERIYLIGPRGSGKTSVAQSLAQALGWGWLDADRVLEEQAGQTIRALFESQGEPAFRDLESAVLRQLATRPAHVLATGGGVILRPENRRLLRDTGLVIRLTADVGSLVQRLTGDATTHEQRPSLTGRSAIDPTEIAGILEAREAFYAQTAHLALDTTGKSIDAIVQELLARLPQEAPAWN